MARSTIITGIDIGTQQIKVVVAERATDGKRNIPHIIGRGVAESKGLRHGYVVSPHDAVRSVRNAVNAAERAAKVSIRQAHISVGGVSLEGITAKGGTVISRADFEVTDTDTEQAIEAAERAVPQPYIQNRKIIHSIPLGYQLDNKPVLGRPTGLKGGKLVSEVLFITALEQHLNDLIQTVEEAGIAVLDVMAAPLAASLVTLTPSQKIAGCVLANIGAETLSIIVFENNLPVSIEVFPIGATAITNDLALGFKISLEEAEEVKLGVLGHVAYSSKHVDQIIAARLDDLFELIEAHLKKIGKSGLLPAGIIITGGGSGITTIEDIAKNVLRIPSRIGIPNLAASSRGEIKDAAWSVAYGLCIWGSAANDEESAGVKIARHTKNKVLEWLRQFLP